MPKIGQTLFYILSEEEAVLKVVSRINVEINYNSSKCSGNTC